VKNLVRGQNFQNLFQPFASFNADIKMSDSPPFGPAFLAKKRGQTASSKILTIDNRHRRLENRNKHGGWINASLPAA
jgi:hypothetical protein